MTSAALFRRNPETAAEIERILELPTDRWSDIEVSFGLEQIGTVKVTFFPTAEQVVALAKLAAYQFSDPCVDERKAGSGTFFVDNTGYHDE